MKCEEMVYSVLESSLIVHGDGLFSLRTIPIRKKLVFESGLSQCSASLPKHYQLAPDPLIGIHSSKPISASMPISKPKPCGSSVDGMAKLSNRSGVMNGSTTRREN
jgi:hypothetical protein